MSHNTTRLALAAAVMMFTLVAWPSAKAVAQGLSTAPDRNTKAAKVGSLDWRNTSVPVSSRTTVLFVEGVGRANNLLYKVREVSVGDLMASPGKEAVLALDYQCDNWNECGQVTGSTIVVVGISNSKLKHLAAIETGTVRSLKVRGGKLKVTTLELHADDASCCPTLIVETTFKPKRGALAKETSRIVRRKE